MGRLCWDRGFVSPSKNLWLINFFFPARLKGWSGFSGHMHSDPHRRSCLFWPHILRYKATASGRAITSSCTKNCKVFIIYIQKVFIAIIKIQFAQSLIIQDNSKKQILIFFLQRSFQVFKFCFSFQVFTLSSFVSAQQSFQALC